MTISSRRYGKVFAVHKTIHEHMQGCKAQITFTWLVCESMPEAVQI